MRMTLEKYLSKNGLTQKDFAAKAGLAQSTISRLAMGRFNPSLELLSRIYDATGGAVRPNDFHKHLRRVSSAAEAAE